MSDGGKNDSPKDSTGALLRCGDEVRIVSVPDLSSMSKEGRAESEPVFEYLVGRYKRIQEIKEDGFLYLCFRYKGQLHSVQIEPELVRKRRTKPPN